jgi:hypothetical protein
MIPNSPYLKSDQQLTVKRSLGNLSRSIARAIGRLAIAGFCHFTIRSETVVRMNAPEIAGVGRWHGRIGIGLDEETLPAQMWTKRRMGHVKAFGFGNHLCLPRSRRSENRPFDSDARDLNFVPVAAQAFCVSDSGVAGSQCYGFGDWISYQCTFCLG